MAEPHPPDTPLPTTPEAMATVAALVATARTAQRRYETFTQQQVDEVCLAAGWAIMEPARNRELAELAVADTGLGRVDDKIQKNHRKTFGLLRDLARVRSVGVISEDAATGIVEIARPVGVVAAVTPSTNPAATPANKVINALKGRNAVIVAPSPKGASTCARLLAFVHAELARIGLPRVLAEGLVQMLPTPIGKSLTHALMMQADLVVATGSQANVRAAALSGTPAFGVGAGNVASIVDEGADPQAAAQRIVRSKTFDNATSCSSENSLIVVGAAAQGMMTALRELGCVMLDATQKAALQARMWPNGNLSAAVIARDAGDVARGAGLTAVADLAPRVLMVEEDGFGAAHPFSGEKLSPVLAVYRARDFAHACRIVESIYAYQGAGHSVSLHAAPASAAPRALQLGLTLPVSRVIVNQAHCVATGGSFDNGLPFSLSMGCGTWGGNNFSDNMTWRQYVNITRIAMPIPERVPTEAEVFGDYFARHGRGAG